MGDTSGEGFQKHIDHEHNLWSYMKFLIFLWEQDKDDDDGLEAYVRRCVENNNLSWFPQGVALALDDVEEEVDIRTQLDELAKKVGESSTAAAVESLTEQVHEMRAGIGTILQQL